MRMPLWDVRRQRTVCDQRGWSPAPPQETWTDEDPRPPEHAPALDLPDIGIQHTSLADRSRLASLDVALNGPDGSDPCAACCGDDPPCFAVEHCVNDGARSDPVAMARRVRAVGGACLVAVSLATADADHRSLRTRALLGIVAVEPLRTATLMGIRLRRHPHDFASDAPAPLYLLTLCCIASARDRRGVGTRLLRAAERWHGAHVATYLCVRRPHGCDASPRKQRACDALRVRAADLLEWYASRGYEVVGESNDYYALRRRGTA